MNEGRMIKRFMECGCEPNLACQLAAIAMEEHRSMRIISPSQPKQPDINITELINAGAQIFDAYQTKRAAESMTRMQHEAQHESTELEYILKIDTREKIFRAAISISAIGALVAVVVWVERADMVVPVLTLIIGLLFKNSSLSEIVSFRKSKRTKSESQSEV